MRPRPYRINISLEPETYNLITKLSEHRKCSRSAIIRDLIDASAPALQQTLDILESVSKMDAKALAAFKNSLAAAEGSINTSVADAVASFEDLKNLNEKK